jgi:hypothetical protein
MNIDKYNLLKNFATVPETMLEISKEESKKINLPIRNIDILIHRWDLADVTIYDIEDFLDHQDYLIAISSDHEHEYFNMGSKYFINDYGKMKRGDFDPMTDILRACYFTLYSFLLSKNLKYNLKDIDIFISLILGIKFDYEKTTLKLPRSEFDAIKNIIKFFKKNHPDKYDSTWWNNLKVGIIYLYDNILPKSEFWINPDKRGSEDLWYELKKLLNLRFETGIWEKHPCYIGDCDSNMTLDKVKDLKRITYLEELFDNPDNKSYIIETPNICENNFHKKYLKYKKKYLKLKNKIN